MRRAFKKLWKLYEIFIIWSPYLFYETFKYFDVDVPTLIINPRQRLKQACTKIWKLFYFLASPYHDMSEKNSKTPSFRLHRFSNSFSSLLKTSQVLARNSLAARSYLQEISRPFFSDNTLERVNLRANLHHATKGKINKKIRIK